MDDYRKIGLGLTCAGVLFLTLGVLLFFDKSLLAMGNILFLAGVSLIIGPRGVVRFFFQRKKIRGTSCFLGGIALVLMGWPIFGMGIEAFGFLNLFGDFFPVVLTFLRNMPVIGNVLSLPPVRAFTDRFVSRSRLPV